MLNEQQRYQGLSAELAEKAERLQRTLRSGDTDAAREDLDSLTRQVADHPEVLRLTGSYHFARGEPALAVPKLVEAARLRPQDALIFHHLGGCFELLGENHEAIKAFQCACNEDPQRAEHWINFGRALSRGGWNEHAAAVYEHALGLSPDAQRVRAMLASALNLDGRTAEASAQYRQILAEHPGSGLSWWGLALLKPMPLGEADVSAMRDALADDALDDYDRIAIHFALGHALEAQGDPAGALASFERAHALSAKGRAPWDSRASEDRLARILEAFAEPSPPQPDDPGREAIFIVSLPRSGSTLVEQILSSHSQVTGTTELPDMVQIIGHASRQHDAPLWEWAPTLDAAGWRALGEDYLRRTARWRKQTPRSTDKLPGNWPHVGAILSMLPNARVVIVRRDPLETALACYRMLLDGHDYAHSFEGLAEISRQFDRTAQAWQSRYPDRVRLQRYEALTADPEGEIRALLDFCDLPFEQGCLAFHATRRHVSTPSAAQVRQPMRRDTARADKYGSLLDPLREAMGLPRHGAGGGD